MKKVLDADDFEDTRDANKEYEGEEEGDVDTGDLGVEALIDAPDFFAFSITYEEVRTSPSLDDAFKAMVGKYGYELSGDSFSSGQRVLTFRKML